MHCVPLQNVNNDQYNVNIGAFNDKAPPHSNKITLKEEGASSTVDIIFQIIVQSETNVSTNTYTHTRTHIHTHSVRHCKQIIIIFITK